MSGKRSFYLLKITLAILAIMGGAILGLPCILQIASYIIESHTEPFDPNSWTIINSTEASVTFIVLLAMLLILGAAGIILIVHLVRRFDRKWKQAVCILLLLIFLCFTTVWGIFVWAMIVGNGIGN